MLIEIFLKFLIGVVDIKLLKSIDLGTDEHVIRAGLHLHYCMPGIHVLYV